tara:strand:- start:4640 stop:4963 length:324 start_codon:yes stop_codon:yes gene_type:complete
MRYNIKEYKSQYKLGNARRLLELALANIVEAQVLIKNSRDSLIQPANITLDNLADELQRRISDITIDDLSIPKNVVLDGLNRYKAHQSLKAYLKMIDIEETFRRDAE